MSTVLPICPTDPFKPARAMLGGGKTELLLGLDIIRKLDITVDFGSDHFRVRQCELEMMTYNEKHHWVFPLVPTACAYANLSDYFRQIKQGEIEVSQTHGDSGIIWKCGKWLKVKVANYKEKWKMQIDNFENENAIQNAFARMANVLSGIEIGKVAVGKLRDVEKLYNFEGKLKLREKK